MTATHGRTPITTGILLFDDAPALDVVLVPGARGTRAESDDPVLIGWLAKVAAAASWVTSVCTGSLLLRAAGLVHGKRITSHWASLDEFRRRAGDDVTVTGDARWVVDGNVVTAAGVSAGTDMGLWLVGQLHDDAPRPRRPALHPVRAGAALPGRQLRRRLRPGAASGRHRATCRTSGRPRARCRRARTRTRGGGRWMPRARPRSAP